jgi:hypothetical protein
MVRQLLIGLGLQVLPMTSLWVTHPGLRWACFALSYVNLYRPTGELVDGLASCETERSRLMANNSDTSLASAPGTSTAVALFQKAHGRMTTLQRIDDQINALLDQRRKLQEELRTVQTLINEEFDRVVRTELPEVPTRTLSITDAARDHSHSRVELAEAVA